MSSVLKKLEKDAEKAREILWQAQLKVYPSSVKVDLQKVFSDWPQIPMSQLKEAVGRYKRTLWLHEDPNGPGGLDKLSALNSYVNSYKDRYAVMVYHNISLALQHPAVIFYECGNIQPDGSRQYRGCRYGVEPHEYISGFGLV
ncbi:MAG TPA: hypothetical protein VFM18_14225 [Methanosarcina sp.]|nr:hypothetical protein [Methanosarcina sp.]